MSATAGPAADSAAGRLGVRAGQAVQELGYDDDVDHDLREAVEALTGGELLDEDDQEVVDVVLLWWREDDGDLVDALVDAQVSLADDGVVWLLTPKAGRPGHVPPSDVQEAAPTAGMHLTSTVSPSRDWVATRIVGGRTRR
ncbi:DUF3052 domain-containing protein [Quadrisphaera sp. DSM 44207]|uniref:DUF3052 domain-containing protein n=1 Tax=Quadrisphaera sp. DSM 44207 TaxID=1881057 RepID=UPI00087EE5E7|nr:DUF3052 domain-containing protein [Quadrisphaera sp. DSM 44207]SDQ04225.1 Protein of unknown function [Quadrisphaera sp. DSM 44207]